MTIGSGNVYEYQKLVVCSSTQIDWGKVKGLAENFGEYGVCSNDSKDHVNYT